MTSHVCQCPSARCREGAQLLGIVGEDGTVTYLGRPIAVDASFVAAASEGRPPETRFRFADRCAENACKKWTGTECQVVGEVISRLPTLTAEQPLPRCSIRAECRWFRQAGANACAVCPLVITDT
jgi:hypothetical protein